jgi:hypothetical protein
MPTPSVVPLWSAILIALAAPGFFAARESRLKHCSKILKAARESMISFPGFPESPEKWLKQCLSTLSSAPFSRLTYSYDRLREGGTGSALIEENPHGPQRASVCKLRWSSTRNGDLLQLADQQRFEAFLTTDQHLKHQQNLTNRSIAILVLPTTSWPVIKNTQPRSRQSLTQ